MTAEQPGTDAATDADSLHVLPLATIPLNSATLRRARMIKDSRFETAVEMFSGNASGSGQIRPADLQQCFDSLTEELIADLEMVNRLAELNSYDVYSLRIELRRLNINVDDIDTLRLSAEKNRQLTQYMKTFTRPLIRQIYGRDQHGIDDIGSLINLFKTPNKEAVVKNVLDMAFRLDIRPIELPQFLEEYGDVFLSLAYYKDIVAVLNDRLEQFALDMAELLSSRQILQDARVSQTCQRLDKRFQEIARFVNWRFQIFDRSSEQLWGHITAANFQQMKRLITGDYTTIGGMLCGLQVKMDAWERKFGGGRGGPLSKADFIMGDFKQGMDVIDNIQRQAPKISPLHTAGTAADG